MHRRENSSVVAEEEQTGQTVKKRALAPEIKSLKKWSVAEKDKPGLSCYKLLGSHGARLSCASHVSAPFTPSNL